MMLIKYKRWQVCAQYFRKTWNLCIVLSCSVSLWLHNEFLCYESFTHALQGYFTDIKAIVWLPKYQWSDPGVFFSNMI